MYIPNVYVQFSTVVKMTLVVIISNSTVVKTNYYGS